MPHNLAQYLSGLNKFNLVAISFVSYLVTFLITLCLPDSFMYDEWIYLFFLPAGSKLICILLFGIWGTMGDVFALILMSALIVLDDQPLWVSILYACSSGLATFCGVHLAQIYLGISSNLRELRYLHIPLLAIIGSVTHGIVTMLSMMLLRTGMVMSHEYLVNSCAMILGDFLGIFVFILAFRLFIKLAIQRRDIFKFGQNQS